MTPAPEDFDALVGRVRRTLARAPVQVAGEVAKVVRDAPPERLEQMMRSPARRVVLDGIFWQMPRFVDRRQTARLNSSVRWCITGRGDGSADVYHLEFSEGHCRVLRGERDTDPRLTITIDGAEFLRIATGGSDPMQAYFTGRLTLSGDIMFAAKLTALFAVPKPPRKPAS